MSPRRLSVDVVQTRLRLMQELLADLEAVLPVDEDALVRDRIRRHAIERVLTQLVELAVGVNAHIVGSRTGEAPTDYRSSFRALGELRVIDEELAASLALAAGMRNLLVHAYGEIDLAVVATAAGSAKADFERYVASVAAWILTA